MNYSELVTALRENNSRQVNEMLKALRPRLMAFLRIHMNASRQDAEDCAHDSLLSSIEAIRENGLEKPEQVVSYILSTCRNTYLKMQNKKQPQPVDKIEDRQPQAPQQLQSLLDEEQERLLEWCMNQLKKEYRRFMQYWFEHPDADAQKVADQFSISVSNAWTRKHRLIKKLNECYEEKSNL